jgi:hypothetical protein
MAWAAGVGARAHVQHALIYRLGDVELTVALATAWRPRGELSRLVQLLPLLRQVYMRMMVSLPPDAES